MKRLINWIQSFFIQSDKERPTTSDDTTNFSIEHHIKSGLYFPKAGAFYLRAHSSGLIAAECPTSFFLKYDHYNAKKSEAEAREVIQKYKQQSLTDSIRTIEV